MTRRKTRTLPSSEDSPKSKRRSSRKRNDVEESPHSEDSEKANCLARSGSKAKGTPRNASPSLDASPAGTRRSLRRRAPSSSADEEEQVPPVKKRRGRLPCTSPNNNSPSGYASKTPPDGDSDDSDSGGVKRSGEVTEHVKDASKAKKVSETDQKEKQSVSRTRKRRHAEPSDEAGASVDSGAEGNCVNPCAGNDADSELRPTGKPPKEEASKRRKVTQKVIADAQHKDEEEENSHGKTNGIDDITLDDWSGWSEGTSDGKKESLLNRVWKLMPNRNAKENVQFSILSYNILAESLLKTSHYFENISPAHWNQQFRHRLLMKELAVVDADIFCLQEVEKHYFQSSLSKELTRLGYESIYACSETPGREEGVALCFRNSAFRLLAERSFPLARIADQLIAELNIPSDAKKAITDYVDEPQMLQCALLECRRSARRVCVSNIHVSYAKHAKPDLRCAQIARTMWEAANLVASNRPAGDPEQEVPLILCGDLNSTPGSPVYQLCRDGYLNDRMLNRLQRVQNIKFPSSEAPVSLVNVLWKAFQHPVENVRSSYYEIFDREPPLTLNLKGNKGCLDYVWFTQSDLQVSAALPPRCGAIKELEDAMPNAEFPSDHLSLAVRFAFP